jgi:uncharacterized protein
MLQNEIIDKIKDYFSNLPVERVYLFGSYSRSTQNEDSDIDLLLEFNNNAHIGLIQFSRMKIDLENVLNHKVDLLTESAISPHIKQFIQNDIVKIYEKSN